MNSPATGSSPRRLAPSALLAQQLLHDALVVGRVALLGMEADLEGEHGGSGTCWAPITCAS